jgi:hypothetical protein
MFIISEISIIYIYTFLFSVTQVDILQKSCLYITSEIYEGMVGVCGDDK